jgi:Phage integrase family
VAQDPRGYRLLEEAVLPAIRFHDLRHSAATILLAMGVSHLVVQKRLGHSSIGITLGVYGHVTTPHGYKPDSYPHITNGDEKQSERLQGTFAKRANLSKWFARKAGPSWERAK